MRRYEIIIYWSDQDGVFVADVPALPGCMAHGDTQESALAEAQAAVGYWLEAAEELGRPIPRPSKRS